MTTDVLALHSLVPGPDLNAYIQTVSALPVLTAEREKELAERFYHDEDLEAARELVLCHLRFVVHLARGYRAAAVTWRVPLIVKGPVNRIQRHGRARQITILARLPPTCSPRF